MVIHDFLCEKCNKIFEIPHEMFDNSPQKCEQCSSILVKQLSVPIVIGDESPKTVGSLADKNADTYSNDEKSKMDKEHGRERKEEPKLWYDKYRTKTAKEIQKINKEETKRYIEKGV